MLDAPQANKMMVNVTPHRVQEGRGGWEMQGKVPERERRELQKKNPKYLHRDPPER